MEGASAVRAVRPDEIGRWWRRAFDADLRAAPQSAWEWTATWAEHMDPSATVLVVGPPASPEMVVPLRRGGSPAMLRTVPPAVGDLFGVVAAEPGRPAITVAWALAAVLAADPGTPLLIQAVDPSVVAALRAADPSCRALATDWVTSPAVPLADSWAAHLARLSHATRGRVRKAERRAAGLGLELEVLTEPGPVRRSVTSSLAQRRRVWAEAGLWPGVSASQADPAWDGFLVDVAGRMSGGGHAVVVALRDRGTDAAVASCLCLRHGGTWLAYHRSGERTRDNIGGILDWMLVRTAIESGASRLDFGRGAEDYKYRVGAVDQARCDVLVGTSDARLVIAAARLRLDAVRSARRAGQGQAQGSAAQRGQPGPDV